MPAPPLRLTFNRAAARPIAAQRPAPRLVPASRRGRDLGPAPGGAVRVARVPVLVIPPTRRVRTMREAFTAEARRPLRLAFGTSATPQRPTRGLRNR